MVTHSFGSVVGARVYGTGLTWEARIRRVVAVDGGCVCVYTVYVYSADIISVLY